MFLLGFSAASHTLRQRFDEPMHPRHGVIAAAGVFDAVYQRRTHDHGVAEAANGGGLFGGADTKAYGDGQRRVFAQLINGAF